MKEIKIQEHPDSTGKKENIKDVIIKCHLNSVESKKKTRW
jgi:hypothetical protein